MTPSKETYDPAVPSPSHCPDVSFDEEPSVTGVGLPLFVGIPGDVSPQTGLVTISAELLADRQTGRETPSAGVLWEIIDRLQTMGVHVAIV